MIVVALARDYSPTGRDYTRQIADRMFFSFPDDPRQRAFGLRTVAGDIAMTEAAIILRKHLPDDLKGDDAPAPDDMRRYGVVFSPKDRPWVINFYGSISAYEAEKQRIRADAFNSGMALLQTIQTMKDMGASRDFVVEYLTKTMLLDEAEAEIYATVVEGGEDQGNTPPKGGFR